MKLSKRPALNSNRRNKGIALIVWLQALLPVLRFSLRPDVRAKRTAPCMRLKHWIALVHGCGEVAQGIAQALWSRGTSLLPTRRLVLSQSARC
jgi:hypothetical protein